MIRSRLLFGVVSCCYYQVACMHSLGGKVPLLAGSPVHSSHGTWWFTKSLKRYVRQTRKAPAIAKSHRTRSKAPFRHDHPLPHLPLCWERMAVIIFKTSSPSGVALNIIQHDCFPFSACIMQRRQLFVNPVISNFTQSPHISQGRCPCSWSDMTGFKHIVLKDRPRGPSGGNPLSKSRSETPHSWDFIGYVCYPLFDVLSIPHEHAKTALLSNLRIQPGFWQFSLVNSSTLTFRLNSSYLCLFRLCSRRWNNKSKTA